MGFYHGKGLAQLHFHFAHASEHSGIQVRGKRGGTAASRLGEMKITAIVNELMEEDKSPTERAVLNKLNEMDIDGSGTIKVGELLTLGQQMYEQEAANQKLCSKRNSPNDATIVSVDE